MRIDADWLIDQPTQKILRLLDRAGHQALVVGGCVRNALLGVPVTDIDIATSARPETVIELAESNGLKAIPTGLAHGTITIVVDKVPFEITTFRRDVETDGRRAVVAYTNALHEDARRRDFTMNAIYANADGVVVDPLGGLPDLNARRVRFIEDANLRIREDYLRSLRFFRFHAQYGDPDAGLDTEALAAIASNLEGLETLPGERVGAEMRKLLAVSNPAPALAAMESTGALTSLLPGASTTFIAPLVHLEALANQPPDTVRRLVVLGGEDAEERLRLSRAEEKNRRTLLQTINSNTNPAEIAWRFGVEIAWSAVLARQAIAGLPLDDATGVAIDAGAIADFPVSAKDLMPDLSGAEIGETLKKLERAWIDSDFALTHRELLEMLRNEG
ncbi:MAG: CCA tRNA nucleotidyltransferase [Boseongicola sp.]